MQLLKLLYASAASSTFLQNPVLNMCGSSSNPFYEYLKIRSSIYGSLHFPYFTNILKQF